MTQDCLIVSEEFLVPVPAVFLWSILVDLPQYHLWNPLNRRIESTLQPGDPVRLWVRDPREPDREDIYVHHVVLHIPAHQLSWEYRKGEIHTRRDQYVRANGPGSCSYFTTDRFFGATGAVLCETYGPSVKRSFNALGAALQRHAMLTYARHEVRERDS